MSDEPRTFGVAEKSHCWPAWRRGRKYQAGMRRTRALLRRQVWGIDRWSRRSERTTGLGQEEPFPARRLSGRCRFSQGTFAGKLGNERDAPTAGILRVANNEGHRIIRRNPGVVNDARSRRGLRGCALRAPCAVRSARNRRFPSAAVNRCRARSADSSSSDACSRYQIAAEAAQSQRGSGPCKGLATTDV
jgi:hypothetical protein